MKRYYSSIFLKSLKTIFILILFPLLIFPNQADSSVVRLKNRTKIKGEIIKKTQNSIIIQNHIIGEKEINWEDISFISSGEVYDSLQKSKILIVAPPPEAKRNFFLNNLAAEFLAGKIFGYDRFIGFGVRANIVLSDLITLGGIAILHLGTNENSQFDGYGPLFYWGPEIGLRILVNYLILEPSLSIGEGSYQSGSQSLLKNNLATKSDLFLAPGLNIKINYGLMKIGLQYKYIIINNQKMSGLYISFGN